jgi:hypothetical protein
METLEKLVRNLVGETALQQIKEGSYETSQLTHDGPGGSVLDDEITLGDHAESGPESRTDVLENLNLAMGQLTILPESEGGTLYAGGTAWDAVFAQFAELKSLLKQARDQGGNLPVSGPHLAIWRDDTIPSNISYLPSEAFHTSHADDEIVGVPELTSCFPFNNCAPPTMAEVLSLLPSDGLMMTLIQRYFNSLLPFYQIVHEGTFKKELKEFQVAPEKVKPGWIALLFTMLASGLMSYSPAAFASFNDTELTHEQTGQKFHRGAKAALVHAQFLRSHTLSVIQALILLQLSIHPDDMAGSAKLRNGLIIVSSWALHGATKNLALQMGLHREPSLFKIKEPEAEIRRRVWWCVYVQDR